MAVGKSVSLAVHSFFYQWEACQTSHLTAPKGHCEDLGDSNLLRAIRALVLMLLSFEPTRHELLPNWSGNEVLSSPAASNTEMLEPSRPVCLAAGKRGTERPVVKCCRPTWDCKANVIPTHCSGMHNRSFSGPPWGDLGAYLKDATWHWFDGSPSSWLLSNGLVYEMLSCDSCLPAFPLAPREMQDGYCNNRSDRTA